MEPRVAGVSMRCPVCGGKTRVVDSRPSGEEIRRRRHCIGTCKGRFTTFERYEIVHVGRPRKIHLRAEEV